jgi:hypothetical protein
MHLDQLDDRPELTVRIGGEDYHFSEVPIAALAGLQSWIRAHVPHPLDAIKGHLDGLAAEDRRELLESARREARQWPPQAGTAAGTAALLATEAGQVEALRAGLAVHRPGTTADDARRIYRTLTRAAARSAAAARRAGRPADEDGDARRIFSVIFGMGDPAADDAEIPLPEA